MGRVFTGVDQLIGNTPIIELKRIKSELGLKADIFAKLEYFNPAGSVKDRVGKAMIDELEKSGRLKQGSVIIEPTSGNTGIGIAAVAAARGYKVLIVMPDTMSVERRRLLSAYGAELVLTDGKKGMAGAIEKANELKESIDGAVIAGQFVNPANPKAHFDTTGPEIFADMDGKLDFFVAGVGTGGTITGVGEYLKSKSESIKIIAVEPEQSQVLAGKVAGAHKLQGIGAGFVPEILNIEIIDEIIPIGSRSAFELCLLMGKAEGILVGISSGAALSAAVELARRDENLNKRIVVLLADTGDRYLSAEPFAE